LDARTAGSASILFDAPSGAVPEPASWALVILGFGVSGVFLRASRSARRTNAGAFLQSV
jgi:hypothetical protein